LYEGLIKFKVTSSHLEVIKDNINAKLPIMVGRSYVKEITGYLITDEDKDWLIENISNSVYVEDKASKIGKLNGILLETDSNYTRLMKFSKSSIYIASTHNLFDFENRIVFPEILIPVVKSFSKSISHFVFGSNLISIVFENGIEVRSSSLYDNYPQSFIESMNLNNNLSLIDVGIDSYKFVTIDLSNAVDLVSNIIGESEYWVQFELIGKSEDNLVWDINGKSYTGVSVSERVLSTNGELIDSFSVNKRSMLKSLNIFENSVYLKDLGKSNIALSNFTGDKVIILTKAVI